MKLMHTKLPEFIEKLTTAAKKILPDSPFFIRGLENLTSAKMQSLRTGRIEHAVAEVAARSDVERVEVVVMPRVPETMHTVLIKGYGKDGRPHKIILDVINIIHSTEEVEFEDCADIEDRRPKLGFH